MSPAWQMYCNLNNETNNVQVEELKQILTTEFPSATITVEGDGHHFNVMIVADDFSGKTKVQQQQMVYKVLNDAIARGDLHAISMKTYTPEQWQATHCQQ